MYNLNLKKVLITGGADGIGRGFTLELLKDGIEKIAILDIDEQKSNELVEIASKEFGPNKAVFYKCNVANGKEFEDVFGKVVNDFGGIDIVLNNAGMLYNYDLDTMINVTFTASARCLELAFKYMGTDNGKPGGVVVNTSSTLGLDALAGDPLYVGCKHGIIGLTKSYSIPFHFKRSNIRVMAICPGTTNTLILEKSSRQSTDALVSEFRRELAKLPTQDVDVVAKALTHILKHGENGSVWVIDDGKLDKIGLKTRHELIIE